MSLSVDLRFARTLYKCIGSPLSLALLKAFDSGDWDYIVNVRVDPRKYEHHVPYLLDALAGNLLRKNPGLPTKNVDRAQKAKDTFFDGERQCKRTNIRLRPYLTCEGDDWDYAVNEHLIGLRKVVRSVLGKFPGREHVIGRHGPGATFSDPAKRSTVGDKMNSRPSCTSGFLENWFPLWELTLWGRAALEGPRNRLPSIVRGGRFATAPKDATTDRPIEAGPSLNVFYQLGIDGIIRRRLRRERIDLDGGQSIHRSLAQKASVDGSLATIDLKNASGTVAKNLVRLLVPTDWLEPLEELRSSSIRLDGRWHILEQYSGMGNGYTFALETLIFYCACKYVSSLHRGERVYTYGDDLIVPSEIVPDLVPFLSFLGFTVNDQKSFMSGPFRESCGGDFFNGHSVRPFFLKSLLEEPHEVIAAANGLRRALIQNDYCWETCKSAWFALLDLLPSDIRRCRGPEDLGDICIHDVRDKWLTRRRSDIVRVRVYRPVSRGFWPKVPNGKVPLGIFDMNVQLACAIYGSVDSGKSPNYRPGKGQLVMPAGITPRNGVTGYKIGYSVFS